MDLTNTHASFGTTNWTLVEALRDGGHPQSERARDLLLRRYWPPIYAAIRRSGYDREAAAELTQAFLVEKVLERGLFEKADSARGTLHALLLTAVRNFLRDQHRRMTIRPDQEGPSLEEIDLEEAFLARETSEDPSSVFDRRWAVAVLEEAVARCERYCSKSGLEKHWAAFNAQVVQPAINRSPPPKLKELTKQLGFPSPAQVASATKVIRKHMRLYLHEVAAETAATLEEQDEAYRWILKVLVR